MKPTPTPPQGAATRTRWRRTFASTFVANFKNQLRYYTFSGWMVSSLLSTATLLATAAVIAHFLTGGSVPGRFFELTGYPNYLPFVVLGLATNGLVLSALDDGATAVYDEEQQGTWDLLALTPMNHFVWMFAKTFAGMVASFVDLLVVLVVGFVLFDFVVTPGTVAVALVGLALTTVALQGFGFLMAAAGLFWKQPYALAMLINPVIVFLSGMVFPVQALPASLQTIAYAFPLTHGLFVIRDALLLGASWGDVTGSVTFLVLTGIGFMAAGYAAFTTMERRARKRGVMGRY